MIYYQDKNTTLYQGKMQEELKQIQENSIDCCICDPPYDLTTITKRFSNSTEAKYGNDGSFQRLGKGFMGKTWDGTGVAFKKETWQEVYRVLKPGAYLLAFGGTRTFHRIACAIEDAGFEIRDTMMWLYGCGFPKSHNIGLDVDKFNGCEDRGHRIATASRNHPDGTFEPNGEKLPKYEGKTEEGKKWQGYGTALKPAYEPIIVARKPIENTVARNCLKYGVGGINIDECRVGNDVITQLQKDMTVYHGNNLGAGSNTKMTGITTQTISRFPANVITDGSDNNEYMRYFYSAKASKKDRDEGLEEFESHYVTDGCERTNFETAHEFGASSSSSSSRKNTHPTVKPTELMQYLIRLVAPKGSTILDCFMGSGSTGKAVMYENKERNSNYKFIGIEMTEEYLPIAKARITYVYEKQEENEYIDLFSF